MCDLGLPITFALGLDFPEGWPRPLADPASRVGVVVTGGHMVASVLKRFLPSPWFLERERERERALPAYPPSADGSGEYFSPPSVCSSGLLLPDCGEVVAGIFACQG